MNDKVWWHTRCTKTPWDKTLLERAREIYPDMFYADGGLVPADMVDFDKWNREIVPVKQSAAYQGREV